MTDRPRDRGVLPRNPGILIVDDMSSMLTLFRIELESRGFTVWLAADGSSAVELYRRRREEIDLVLLDVQMPDPDGPLTLAALRRVDPGVVACFMTEVPGNYTEEELLARGAVCTFTKPFRSADVARFLQALVAARRSGGLAEWLPFACDWEDPLRAGRGKTPTEAN